MAPSGDTALIKAMELAKLLAAHPQRNLRNDRMSVHSTFDWPAMLKKELFHGMDTLKADLPQVRRFVSKL